MLKTSSEFLYVISDLYKTKLIFQTILKICKSISTSSSQSVTQKLF